MAQNLYDVQGYEIKLEMTRTFNPSKAGAGSDIRDLGVLVLRLHIELLPKSSFFHQMGYMEDYF